MASVDRSRSGLALTPWPFSLDRLVSRSLCCRLAQGPCSRESGQSLVESHHHEGVLFAVLQQILACLSEVGDLSPGHLGELAHCGVAVVDGSKRLAFTILLAVTDRHEAYKYARWFAQGCLARIPEREPWALTTDEVRDWLAKSHEMKVETDESLPLEVKPARRYRP